MPAVISQFFLAALLVQSAVGVSMAVDADAKSEKDQMPSEADIKQQSKLMRQDDERSDSLEEIESMSHHGGPQGGPPHGMGRGGPPPGGLPSGGPSILDPAGPPLKWESYDTDKSGSLEGAEIGRFIKDVGIPAAQWKVIDSDNNNEISRDGFIRTQADKHVYSQFDLDHSSLLEENEVNNVLKRAGLSPNEFNWHPYDADKDGKLSLVEFLAAGPAVGNAAAQQAKSLMEEEEGEGPDENLEDDEASLLMEDDDESLTNEYDTDDSEEGEGEGFDEDESSLLEEGEEEGGDEEEEEEEGGTEGSIAREQVDVLFSRLDKSKDKSLQPDEIMGFLGKAKLEQRLPAKFDKDQSMSLSQDEFFSMAKYIAKKQPKALERIKKAYSLAQEGESDDSNEGDLIEGDEEEEDEEGAASGSESESDEDMSQHFKDADEDGNGQLEESEMKKLLTKMNMENFDWRSLDQNKDGKLSLEEFEKAMQE